MTIELKIIENIKENNNIKYNNLIMEDSLENNPIQDLNREYRKKYNIFVYSSLLFILLWILF
jgi:hypothetical protein